MKIHSMLDLVTNSSSVTYIWSTDLNVKFLKDFVQKILDISGFKGSLDDILEIKLTAHDDFKNLVCHIVQNPEFFIDEDNENYLFHKEVYDKVQDLWINPEYIPDEDIDDNLNEQFYNYLDNQLHLDFPEWCPDGWALVNAVSNRMMPSTVIEIKGKNVDANVSYMIYNFFKAANFSGGTALSTENDGEFLTY